MNSLPLVPQVKVTDQDLGPEKPIAVTLDAQEIGRLHVQNGGPYAFTQSLLEKFKVAGAPVHGAVHLRLQHGKICKVKNSPQGPGFFSYVWLPESYVQAIEAMGGFRPPWLT